MGRAWDHFKSAVGSGKIQMAAGAAMYFSKVLVFNGAAQIQSAASPENMDAMIKAGAVGMTTFAGLAALKMGASFVKDVISNRREAKESTAAATSLPPPALTPRPSLGPATP